MRTTQYIGLTNAAKEFVKDFAKTPIEVTTGMFDDPVIGHEFISPDGHKYIELLQCSPWSSGPMIFTCLLDDKTEKRMFMWKEDKSVSGKEFDRDLGLLWV